MPLHHSLNGGGIINIILRTFSDEGRKLGKVCFLPHKVTGHLPWLPLEILRMGLAGSGPLAVL